MYEIKPSRIRLDASTFCQLQCPACPTVGKEVNATVGRGFLRLVDFKSIIAENPWLKEIEISNYGEIFLNPELLEIIKCADEYGVFLRADNGVNLNTVKVGVLEGLVKYNFRSMSCSIDSSSKEVYQIYKVKGNFDVVIENIRTINRFKQQYRTDYPQLRWQFVVFGHNEHEILSARNLAAELGMSFYLKLSWDDKFSPIKDYELVRAEVGTASRDEFKKNNGVDYMQGICHQLWEEPQINWDGKVLGCCRNFWGDFGANAFKDGLINTINSKKIKYARGMLLGKNVAREDIPCAKCNIYLGMKASGKWLQREEKTLVYRAMKFLHLAR